MCAYFSPYVDEAGLHLPTYNDILEKRISDAKSIFGQDIYLGNDSADYQSISVESLALSEAMQAIQYAYNQMSPATAIGAGLSSIVQYNGIIKKAASYSTCEVELVGTSATTIIDGVVQDIAGNKWNLPTPITLQQTISPVGYGISVTATCATIGSINALPGDINSIVTPTAGWTAVINPLAAIAGQPVETDSQLRERQAISVALPSQTMLAGTIAAIASALNVARYVVYENPSNSTHYGDPGVPFEGAPAHSITAIVEGGTDDDIANIIYANRGLGCYTNGDVVINITDTTYGTVTPIRFYRPVYVPIYVLINIHSLTGYTTATTAAIKAAVYDYLNSLEIGESVIQSSIIGAALSVMSNSSRPTFSITSLKIGETASPVLTTDITLDYNEVAQGVENYIIINLV